MNPYSVYRVDYLTSRTEQVGSVLERRKKERHNNVVDLLRLAQSLYSYSALNLHIFIQRDWSWTKHASPFPVDKLEALVTEQIG